MSRTVNLPFTPEEFLDRSRLSRLAWNEIPLHHCTTEQLIACIEDLHRNLDRTRAERDAAQTEMVQLRVSNFKKTQIIAVLS